MMRHTIQKSLHTRLAALALSVTALLGILAVNAAALEPTTVTVELRPSVTIVVDDVTRTFYNAAGKEVHPIYYNGTHYLPVRAIGELMGKNVNWDGAAKTITLSSPRVTAAAAGTPDTAAKDQQISVQIRPDFTIVVDGVKRAFTDAKSKALADAGLSASQVTFTKAKLDRDDGRQVYEVEFRYGTKEYEYEIDAYTGAVLSREAESIYD